MGSDRKLLYRERGEYVGINLIGSCEPSLLAGREEIPYNSIKHLIFFPTDIAYYKSGWCRGSCIQKDAFTKSTNARLPLKRQPGIHIAPLCQYCIFTFLNSKPSSFHCMLAKQRRGYKMHFKRQTLSFVAQSI